MFAEIVVRITASSRNVYRKADFGSEGFSFEKLTVTLEMDKKI